jgi:hypothetical protein
MAWLMIASVVGAMPGDAPACGPCFPNMLLTGGDGPLLVAPVSTFQAQLARMNLGLPAFTALIPTNGHPSQTADADKNDLRAALPAGVWPVVQRERILEEYQGTRRALQDYAAEIEAWKQSLPRSMNGVTNARPAFVARREIAGLPGEFADYLRGAMSWHAGRTNDARTAWEALLQRPAASRRFKSTWAAFMLGKSWEAENADRAIRYFREVRALAKAGFADSPGLAASSLGWEARQEYERKRYEPAIELYLDQLASGDPSAIVSLRLVAAAALSDRNAPLRRLAANARCRQVITAYLIAGGNGLGLIDIDGSAKEAMLGALTRAPWIGPRAAGWHTMAFPGRLWLDAVESAKVRDVEAAEQFALAAYQCGEMETARRWIACAKQSPVAQWLQAKLLLRDGKLDEAAELLAQISRAFPVEPGKNQPSRASFAQVLFVRDYGYLPDHNVGQQMLGELGALRLARREFTEALDCLLHAGFWIDAAYVAERVLTVDELKTYVDRHWPASAVSDSTKESADPIALSAPTPREQIRHLLARRLGRLGRGVEARAYLPVELHPKLDTLLAGLRARQESNQPPAQRATALWEAANVARRLGLELLGTEVEPDWAGHGGAFEYGPSASERSASDKVGLVSSDELRRARNHAPEPDARFHYRYTAAALAWDAAKLMPNNSDETARVLCIAGSWLKNIDPQSADLFYKALVRRCRQTVIGRTADLKRWFPKLDEEGNLASAEAK